MCKGKESPVQTCSISSYHKQSPREGSSRWSTCPPHSMLLISSYFSNRVAFSTSHGKYNSECGPTSVIGLSAHQSLSSTSRPASPKVAYLVLPSTPYSSVTSPRSCMRLTAHTVHLIGRWRSKHSTGQCVQKVGALFAMPTTLPTLLLLTAKQSSLSKCQVNFRRCLNT